MEAKPESRGSDTFKPDMPPPPSPASSTCSDHSGPAIVSPAPLSEYQTKKSTQRVQTCAELLPPSECCAANRRPGFRSVVPCTKGYSTY